MTVKQKEKMAKIKKELNTLKDDLLLNDLMLWIMNDERLYNQLILFNLKHYKKRVVKNDFNELLFIQLIFNTINNALGSKVHGWDYNKNNVKVNQRYHLALAIFEELKEM